MTTDIIPISNPQIIIMLAITISKSPVVIVQIFEKYSSIFSLFPKVHVQRPPAVNLI